MIREYGMSDKARSGLSRGRQTVPVSGRQPRGKRGDYSEATAEIIDKEIRESIRREYERALAILREKKEILIRGARLLLEKEKLDGEEIRALLALPAAPAGAATQ